LLTGAISEVVLFTVHTPAWLIGEASNVACGSRMRVKFPELEFPVSIEVWLPVASCVPRPSKATRNPSGTNADPGDEKCSHSNAAVAVGEPGAGLLGTTTSPVRIAVAFPPVVILE
jgi:hypothetical protein